MNIMFKFVGKLNYNTTESMENIDWANLKFGYMPTDYNVRCYYRNGKWGEIEVSSSDVINIHMAATALHYGQEAFEGMKAFRCPDGKIRAFRIKDNAERLQSTCRGILMPELPTELFEEMVKKVVKLNERFVPPYESGASLYIRPLLIGTGAQVGVHPANEYLFMIFVSPVGPYFKGGFATNDYVIIREYDRAAPLGTGRYKVGGNYAASLAANKWHMTQVMLQSSIWMQRRRSTLTNVVLPISLVSKKVSISPPSHHLSFLLSPIAVCSS